MSDDDFAVALAPPLVGHLTRPTLLGPEFTLHFQLIYERIAPHCVFEVRAPAFEMKLLVSSEALVFTRNGLSLEAPMAYPLNRRGPLLVILLVSPTLVSLRLTDAEGKRVRNLETPPALPPHALLEWARRESLLPVSSYESPRQLFQSVLDHFELLKEKILDTNAINGFWDISYEGNRVTTRTPKREVDIHPQLHLLLYDLDLQRGLQVVPEYEAGSGRLDFLIVGRTNDGTTVKVCLEVKLAHAKDIAHGVEVQLPEYMRRTKTDYGIYMVLAFGKDYPADTGKFLKNGLADSGMPFDMILPLAAANTGNSHLKTLIFDLSRRASPSKA